LAPGSSGIPLLGKSLAAAECEVEEIIERYSHGIIVGRLLNVKLSDQLSGLIYWNGKYVEVDHASDLDRLAEIGIPLARVR
jgi:flavin reductase (DIM6/NTAB) family NADH-FMN oxidoreductase RutF